MKNYSIPPAKWRSVDDWQNWTDLPSSCCYRLRLINEVGEPVAIPRLLKGDPSGLLYIGETGPVEDSEGLHRVAALARGLARRVTTDADGRTVDERVVPAVHGVVDTFRAIGLFSKLNERWPGCSLQIAWETTEEIEVLTSTDDITNANAAAHPGNQRARNRTVLPPTESVLSSSGKEAARLRERELLDAYEAQFGEPPPLNDKAGEYMRNTDQRTGKSINESLIDAAHLGDRSVAHDILRRMPREVIEAFLAK